MFSKSYFAFQTFPSYHFFWGAAPAPKSPGRPHTFCFCPSSHLIALHNFSGLPTCSHLTFVPRLREGGPLARLMCLAQSQVHRGAQQTSAMNG